MTVRVAKRSEMWPVTMDNVERIWCDEAGWHLRIRLTGEHCMLWHIAKHDVQEIYAV